ncbi:MAG: LD-carboxypeptidase [Nocardioidaceae bacterium]
MTWSPSSPRAIVTLRGGCGSLRVTPSVDVAALREDRKPIVAFSDITALLSVWYAAGVTSLHGCIAGAHAENVRDRLPLLDVPVLAGLPLGHLADPFTVPLGSSCVLDADAGTLTCSAGLVVD